MTPSRSSDIDRVYLEAYQRGDAITLQSLVEAAAEDAGYSSRPLWHGSPRQFNAFAKWEPTDMQLGFGYHLAENRDFAARYGSPKKLFAMVKNTLDAEQVLYQDSDLGKKFSGIISKDSWFPQEGRKCVWLSNALDEADPLMVAKVIQEAGFDSVSYKSKITEINGPHRRAIDESPSIIVFNPSQVKSAEVAEVDANGGLLPLTQRFDPTTDDLRGGMDTDSRHQQRLVDAAVLESVTLFNDIPGAAAIPVPENRDARRAVTLAALNLTTGKVGVGRTHLDAYDDAGIVFGALNDESDFGVPEDAAIQQGWITGGGMFSTGIQYYKLTDDRFLSAPADGEMPLRHRFVPTEDSRYSHLIEAGKVEAAERMLEAAASRCGFETVGYHATDVEFREFENPELGFHFAASEELAVNAAIKTGKAPERRMKVFLSMASPVALPGQPNGWPLWRVLDSMQEDGMISSEEHSVYMERYYAEVENDGDSSLREEKVAAAAIFRDLAKSKGFDSVKYWNEFDSGLNHAGSGEDVQPGWSFIVLDAAQIRNADLIETDGNGHVRSLSQRFPAPQKEGNTEPLPGKSICVLGNSLCRGGL